MLGFLSWLRTQKTKKMNPINQIARWSVALFGLLVGYAALVMAIIPNRGSTREFLKAVGQLQAGYRESANYPSQEKRCVKMKEQNSKGKK